MALENPPIFEHGFVQGRFAMAVADTTRDPDRYPDLEPMGGTIRIVPLREIHLTGGIEQGAIPTTVSRRPRDFNLDSQGYLVDAESEADSDLKPGVWLAHGVYRVEFNLTPRVNMPSYQILVEPKHTKENPLNLTEQAPIVTPPGYIEVVRAEDRIRAELAAVEAGEALEQARILTQEDTFIALVAEADTIRDDARSIEQTIAGHRLVTEANANSAQDSAQSASESATASGEALAELNDQVDQATVQANRAESEAGDAASSAQSASASADAASASEDAASLSEQAAAGASGAAEASRVAAEQARDTAVSSASEASSSATSASDDADTAVSAAQDASASASSASQDASSASQSASDASSSATSASADASAAQTARSAAETAAQEAADSQDAAKSSADAADAHRLSAEEDADRAEASARRFVASDTPPANPQEGDIWLDTSVAIYG